MRRSSGSRRRGRRSRIRRLVAEPLEARRVLDATGAVLVGSVADDLAAGDLAAGVAPDPGEPAAFGERFSSSDELQSFLVDQAVEQWGSLFGQPIDYWLPPVRILDGDSLGGMPAGSDMRVMFAPASAGGGDVAEPSAAFADTGSADTNNQVVGVDEGDIVKTDGRFIYMLRDNDLLIVETDHAGQLDLAYRGAIQGQAVDLFIHGDRLTVVTQLPTIFPMMGRPAGMGGGAPLSGVAAPSYGPPQPALVVALYDVEDRTTPIELHRSEIEGRIVQTRSIGSDVILVTQDSLNLPRPDVHCTDVPVGVFDQMTIPEVEHGRGCSYETQDAYVARVEGEIIELSLPDITVFVGTDGTTGALNQAENIFKPVNDLVTATLSITVFDSAGDQAGPTSSTGLLDQHASRLYVSEQSVYVMSADWQSLDSQSTRLLKFAFQDDSHDVALVATGLVPGRLLEQFAMDERGDEFRIVVQDGWREDMHTDLYVLTHTGNELEITGQIDGMAAGEGLFAVRFEQERAYVVTFGQIASQWLDPLFTIDLSDPTSPRVAGELELPGFSDYLHVVGDGLLVGVGHDVDEQTGLRRAPQVSLFDVSDFANPRLVDQVSLSDSGGAWTAVSGDHHAFNFFPQFGALTVPVGVPWSRPVPGPDGLEQPVELERSGLSVLRVDSQARRLEVLGRLEHEQRVERSLRIGQTLYSVSRDTIQSHDILDPERVLDELDLRGATTDEPPPDVVDPATVETGTVETGTGETGTGETGNQNTSEVVTDHVTDEGQNEEGEDQAASDAAQMPRWHNDQAPEDVNGDGLIAPGDLLMVFNDLNERGPRPLLADAGLVGMELEASNLAGQNARGEGEGGSAFYYPDVNDDDFISPMDALRIINRLNQQAAAAPGVGSGLESGSDAGEGEARLELANIGGTVSIRARLAIQKIDLLPPPSFPQAPADHDDAIAAWRSEPFVWLELDSVLEGLSG